VTAFARFHVDLVTGLTMTGTPDEVQPLVPIELPGVARTTYRAYPVADHIADKVCGMLETHDRGRGAPVASTRYRDLADLVRFAHTERVSAHALVVALRSEAQRRGLVLPDRLSTPAGSSWAPGYARLARGTPGIVERDLSAALETAGRLIDPVLGEQAQGRWDPDRLAWQAD